MYRWWEFGTRIHRGAVFSFFFVLDNTRYSLKNSKLD